jgi:hypothetical protein
VEIKCQLDATDEFFIADLIACSTCFGHLYAHHQELESIIQVVAACRIWCLVFKLSVWCGAEGFVSGLRAASSSYTNGLPDDEHIFRTICVHHQEGHLYKMMNR